MLRLFVGIAVPEKIRRAVSGLTEQARTRMPGFRWLDPGGYHLTPRFLGAVDRQQLPRLTSALDAIGKHHPTMTLHLSDWGVFPSLRRPRVLWLGIGGDHGPLAVLAEDLARLPPPTSETKPFIPHLTVARTRHSKALSNKLLTSLLTCADSWTVTEMHLYESTLHPNGSRYRIIHSSSLSGSKTHS